ncbi:MAG: hypothetical protein Q9Q40_08570 [Acidobacteriota bacterium]|nr:hypothetical protein [Acidobacteriota bacterium]MDQ7088969.1 hypothetical protein [Acidobacteriota bacterium]
MLPALKVGGRYRAVVERIVSSRRILLRLGGERISARVAAPVREGEVVTVEVEHLVPEVVLRIRRKEVPAGAEKSAAVGGALRSGDGTAAGGETERNLQQAD